MDCGTVEENLRRKQPGASIYTEMLVNIGFKHILPQLPPSFMFWLAPPQSKRGGDWESWGKQGCVTSWSTCLGGMWAAWTGTQQCRCCPSADGAGRYWARKRCKLYEHIPKEREREPCLTSYKGKNTQRNKCKMTVLPLEQPSVPLDYCGKRNLAVHQRWMSLTGSVSNENQEKCQFHINQLD